MFARVTQLVLILALLQHCVQSFDSRNVVIVILSQSEPYHASVAMRLKQNIETQVEQLEDRYPTVHLTHDDFPVPGGWTILPLLRPLSAMYSDSDVRWILFVEAHTAVRCEKLFEALAAADKQKETKWIGYPLSDVEPTIIHHFAIYEDLEEEGGFVYPNIPSGFAMRMDLVDMLVSKIESSDRRKEAEFSIDAGYELAQLVYSGGEGPLLTPELAFCLLAGDACAVYPTHHAAGRTIPEDSILFAVKTWSGFHDTRVRVVKKTWGRYVTNLVFYSDLEDPSIPTIPTGVPNTKTGHCAKTMAILKNAVNRTASLPHVKWIFLADDDTILGVQRLCEVLSSYRGGGDVTILGERYGYGYGNKDMVGKGYDYITGGGGTALSVGAARVLTGAGAGAGGCACAARGAPDDMTLGACATSHLRVPLTHSPLFHQARPQDYPREVVSLDRPVSFHRHSSPDPLKVYATWFQHDDLALKKKDEL